MRPEMVTLCSEAAIESRQCLRELGALDRGDGLPRLHGMPMPITQDILPASATGPGRPDR
jgi:hypothetical protein